jgi:hypothetical protein
MGDVRAVATGGYLTASGGGDVRAIATAGYLVTKGGARLFTELRHRMFQGPGLHGRH